MEGIRKSRVKQQLMDDLACLTTTVAALLSIAIANFLPTCFRWQYRGMYTLYRVNDLMCHYAGPELTIQFNESFGLVNTCWCVVIEVAHVFVVERLMS